MLPKIKTNPSPKFVVGSIVWFEAFGYKQHAPIKSIRIYPQDIYYYVDFTEINGGNMFPESMLYGSEKDCPGKTIQENIYVEIPN